MQQIFRQAQYFAAIYFLILGLDIWVKLMLDPFPYRYISKPLIILLLLGYYYYNQKEEDKKKYLYVMLGLFCFLVGDIFFITHLSTVSLITGMVFFMFGKIFYSFKFSHISDFDLKRLIPFLLVIFAFMALLFSFIYDNLGDYFIPVLFYFFVSLLTLQIAYLRKSTVNFKSYMLVLVGLELFVIGESVMALKMFYKPLPYQDILTMLLYGVSQYLIIVGLLKEDIETVSTSNN